MLSRSSKSHHPALLSLFPLVRKNSNPRQGLSPEPLCQNQQTVAWSWDRPRTGMNARAGKKSRRATKIMSRLLVRRSCLRRLHGRPAQWVLCARPHVPWPLSGLPSSSSIKPLTPRRSSSRSAFLPALLPTLWQDQVDLPSVFRNLRFCSSMTSYDS